MTANAIAYAKYLEDRRHNYVQERLEAKKRQLEQFQAEIADRKQRADALYQKGNLQESQRHNIETEQMTKIFNDASVYLKYLQHREDVRHNVEMESVSNEGNQIGWLNADIAQQNTDINRAHQEEYARSNKEYERLTERGQDIQSDTSIRVANIHKDATIESANIHADATVTAASTSASATRYMANSNYASTIYASNMNYQLGQYVADNEYTMNRENITSKEKIATRDRMAQTNRTRITSGATRYSADQSYKGKVYDTNVSSYNSLRATQATIRNTNLKVVGDLAGKSLDLVGRFVGGFR